MQRSHRPSNASHASHPSIAPKPPSPPRSLSEAPTSSPPTQPNPRRLPKSDHPEVIGVVLSDKKFRCANVNCRNSQFGRQADLYRHYKHTHAPNRAQLFCPVSGCRRSRFPANGKMRGFGTRKDKVKEHCRTVHRGMVDLEGESPNGEEDGEEDGDEE